MAVKTAAAGRYVNCGRGIYATLLLLSEVAIEHVLILRPTLAAPSKEGFHRRLSAAYADLDDRQVVLHALRDTDQEIGISKIEIASMKMGVRFYRLHRPVNSASFTAIRVAAGDTAHTHRRARGTGSAVPRLPFHTCQLRLFANVYTGWT